MIKINLVPQDVLDREVQKQRIAQVGVVAGVVVVLLAGVSYAHWHAKVTLQAELKVAQAEMEKLKDAKNKLDLAKRRQEDVKRRRGILQELLSSRKLYPVFMSDMIDVLPSAVWIEALDSKNTSLESLDLSISALAQRPEDVAGWLRALNSTSTGTFKTRGQFSAAVLGADITISELQNKFSLKMKYDAPR